MESQTGRLHSIFTKLKEEFRVNSYMLVPKTAYFFYFACYGTLFTFNTTFLTDIGLSPKQAGFINGLRAVPMVIGNITWCMVADKTKKHRLIILSLIVLATGMLLPMPWVAQYLTKTTCVPAQVSWTTNATVIATLVPETNTTVIANVTATPHTTLINSTVHGNDTVHSSECEKTVQQNLSKLFRTMLIMNLAAGFLYGPFISFSDNIVSTYVSRAPRKTHLSQQIRFTSLGWGVAPTIVGALANYVAVGNVSPFVWIFIIYAACISIFFAAMSVLYAPVTPEKATEKPSTADRPKDTYSPENDIPPVSQQIKGNRLYDLLNLLKNPHVIFFYVTILFLTTGFGMQGGFLLIFLGDLGASSLNKGLTTLFDQGGEFLLCSLINPVTKLVGNEMRALVISCVLCALRTILVSYLTDPWLVCPYLTMTSLFHPLFVTCGLQVTMKMAPPHLRTTLFGFFDSIYTSGIMIGNMLGGIVYETYGGAGLFRRTSIILAGWVTLLLIYSIFFKIEWLTSMKDRLSQKESDKPPPSGAELTDMQKV